MAKVYTVIKTHRGKEREITGTMEELIKYFKYTLDSGYSWNHKINTNPKTGKSLVTQLNKCVDELQGGYSRDFYDLKEI